MDIAGWQNTTWGMSTDEIIGAVGPKVQRCTRQTYGIGYHELLIPRVKIGSADFTVYFVMGDFGLRQVNVRYDGGTPPDHREGDQIAGMANKLLQERFGVGQRRGTSDDWCWKMPTTVIELSRSKIDDVMDLIVIAFRASSDPLNEDDDVAF